MEYSFADTSRFANLNNVKIHYHDVGSGDVLVLLHGGGPGASGWSNFKQNIVSLAQHFRLLILDQPAFGLSEVPEFDRQYFDYTAKILTTLLDTLGIEKVHLLGNSLGGGVSLKFVLDHPERVERIILMGPGGAFFPLLSPYPGEGMKALFDYMEPPGPSREKMKTFIRSMIFNPIFITDELINERFKAASEPKILAGFTSFLAAAQGRNEEEARSLQLWRDLDQITHPILLTWGREDRVMALDGALFAMRSLVNARLHVFPNCGHWAQLEHQHEFDCLTINFLTQPLN